MLNLPYDCLLKWALKNYSSVFFAGSFRHHCFIPLQSNIWMCRLHVNSRRYFKICELQPRHIFVCNFKIAYLFHVMMKNVGERCTSKLNEPRCVCAHYLSTNIILMRILRCFKSVKYRFNILLLISWYIILENCWVYFKNNKCEMN